MSDIPGKWWKDVYSMTARNEMTEYPKLSCEFSLITWHGLEGNGLAVMHENHL